MNRAQHSVEQEDIRTAILDAIGRLLEKYGYKKMTVDDIAHEAGIGKGTVYLHFSSKEEAALSWFDRIHGELIEKMLSIARSQAEPAQRIRQMLVGRVMFSFDHMQTFALSLDDLFAAVRLSLLSRRDRYHSEEAAALAMVLKDGCETEAFAIDNIPAVAESLVLAMNSLLPYSLSTAQLGERDQIQAKANQLAALVLNGLLRRS